MIKLAVGIIVTIIAFIVNRLFIAKEKYFFPLILLTLTIILTIASIVQIRDKESNYSIGEVQTIQIEENKANENIMLEDRDTNMDVSLNEKSIAIDSNEDIKVSTKKTLFAIDLFKGFIVFNIPTIICVLDILQKKGKLKINKRN